MFLFPRWYGCILVIVNLKEIAVSADYTCITFIAVLPRRVSFNFLDFLRFEIFLSHHYNIN